MITQPQEDAKLSKPLQNRINKVKTQLAIEEQEVIVLKSSKHSLKSEITQLIKDKNGLIDEIAVLSDKIDTLKNEFNGLKSELLKATNALDDVRKEKADAEATITEDYKIFAENDKKLKISIGEHNKEVDKFNKERDEFIVDKLAHDKFVDKLKKVLNV